MWGLIPLEAVPLVDDAAATAERVHNTLIVYQTVFFSRLKEDVGTMIVAQQIQSILSI
jgi:hypothetical protein